MIDLAMYAGTFDPLTYGHLDLVERSAEIFPEVLLAVAEDDRRRKPTLFDAAERCEMIRTVVAGLPNVEVKVFDGLLIQYARSVGAKVLIRGLRAYSDFEYEFQMALTNRKLAPEIETLFMMPKEIHSYVSSSTVKEVARLGGDISEFVPPQICEQVSRKYLEKRGAM